MNGKISGFEGKNGAYSNSRFTLAKAIIVTIAELFLLYMGIEFCLPSHISRLDTKTATDKKSKKAREKP
jgi:hypothetical protein